MNLKKINPNLQKALIENGLTEPNEMQQETFSTIKSGADAVIQSLGGSGKSTTIAINVIQRLEIQPNVAFQPSQKLRDQLKVHCPF